MARSVQSNVQVKRSGQTDSYRMTRSVATVSFVLPLDFPSLPAGRRKTSRESWRGCEPAAPLPPPQPPPRQPLPLPTPKLRRLLAHRLGKCRQHLLRLHRFRHGRCRTRICTTLRWPRRQRPPCQLTAPSLLLAAKLHPEEKRAGMALRVGRGPAVSRTSLSRHRARKTSDRGPGRWRADP